MASSELLILPAQYQYGSTGSVTKRSELEFASEVGQKLRRKFRFPNNIQHRFIPKNEIEAVLGREVIREILRHKIDPTTAILDESVDIILGIERAIRFINIFAILMLIDQVTYITQFITAGIGDAHLPLIDPEGLYNRLHACDTGKLELFFDTQWCIYVPTFNLAPDEVESKVFPSLTRFPFLHQELIKSQGGQGEVSKVVIHSKHIQGNIVKDSHFAIKKFAEADRQRWDDEIRALTRYSGSQSGHPHLIKLLAAYHHEGKGLYLIFPLAEGNLADLWKAESTCSRLFDDACWLLTQCLGITSGLCKIHSHDSWPTDKLGRHGDIKPENILWFKNPSEDRGRLVVADFTLTRFHTDATVDVTIPGQRGYTRTFRPPEVDFKPKTQKAQSYDVWSLGCVFLEFVAWYLLGYHAIRGETYVDQNGQSQQGFNDARVEDDDCRWGTREDKYFNGSNCQSGKMAEVKESVVKWIQLLHRSSQCSEAMHHFLDLIANSMLVVDPRDRCDMQTVKRELQDILNQSDNHEFACVGSPRCTPGGDIGHPVFRRKAEAADNAYQTSISEGSSENSPLNTISLDTIDAGEDREYQKIAKALSLEPDEGTHTQQNNAIDVDEDEMKMVSPESLSPKHNKGDRGKKYNFSHGQESESQASSLRCTSQVSMHGQAAMSQSCNLSSQASESYDDTATPTTRLSTSCGMSRVSSSRGDDDVVEVFSSTSADQPVTEILSTTCNTISETDDFESKGFQYVSGCAPSTDNFGIRTMQSRPGSLHQPTQFNLGKQKSVIRRRRKKLKLAWRKFWRTILGRKK